MDDYYEQDAVLCNKLWWLVLIDEEHNRLVNKDVACDEACCAQNRSK